MSGYRLKVSGDKETALAFRRLGFKARDLERAFQSIGNEVARDARILAPKDTGRLAGDIRAGAAKTRASIAAGRASIPYAPPIHWGWRRRNIEPQPFLKEAADSKAESAAVTIAREMDRLIRSVGLS